MTAPALVRRLPTRALALALGSLVLLVGFTAAHGRVVAQGGLAAGQERPNVVVVMTDDQDVRSLEVMSAVRRELVREGTTFDNSFATFPLCCPSRATFLTGQYAHNHGVVDNSAPDGGYAAFDDRETLPVWLRRADYRTGYIGKYLNGYGTRGNDPSYIPPGWDRWYGKISGGMFDYELNENGRVRRYGDGARHYQTDLFARKATGFIEDSAARAEPFFLAVAPSAPHTEGREPPRPAPRHEGSFDDEPLPRPPSFDEADVSDKPSFVRERERLDSETVRKLKRRYRGRLASLLAVDEAVERVVRKLERVGELDHTLIVFTSDNGYLLGEHRLTRKTALYEESAQVPLIMRGPGIPPNVVRQQITGNIDLAPTILDLANAPAGPEPLDGISLLPVAASASVAGEREILLENKDSLAIRTRNYMYARHPNGERELYDMTIDPFQLESRHGDPTYEPIQADLADRLRALKDCKGAECR